MPEPSSGDLAGQLLAAHSRIAELTRTNLELDARLLDAGLALKRSRRSARQDGNTLREEISVLQNRRG
jgi:hypothetical protein